MLSRRNLLLAGVALLPAVYAAGADRLPFPKIVSLDLAITESLLGLSIIPVAVANKRWYQNFIRVPQLPDRVLEVGLPGEPNLELLQAIKPDVILCSQAQAQVNVRLKKIAPVVAIDIFRPDMSPWHAAQKMMSQLGQYASVSHAAEKLNAEATELLSVTASVLNNYHERPVFLARINDDGRHLLLFGDKGMYDFLLREMGFQNACELKTNVWGGAIASLDYLFRQPDARLIFFNNRRDKNNTDIMLSSPLWQTIPLIREGRLSRMNRLYPGGGLLSAMRFLREFESAMRMQAI